MTHPDDYLGANWPQRDRWAASELRNWAVQQNAGMDGPPRHPEPPQTSTEYVAEGRACDDPDPLEVPDTDRARYAQEALNRIVDEKMGFDVILKTHYRDNFGWPPYVLKIARYWFWRLY